MNQPIATPGSLLTHQRQNSRLGRGVGAASVVLLLAGTLSGCSAAAVRVGAALAHRGDFRGARDSVSAMPPSSTTVARQPPPGSCHARGSGLLVLPDPVCTPGLVNPAVTPATLRSTICATGWTRTVRPPESVTRLEKRASLAAYGDRGALSGFEYDHLVSLELGGAPNDPRNLWPEPQAGPPPNVKDRLENKLAALVCRGRVALADAQQAIASDWVAAYRRYVGPLNASSR
jgi:hypothetical protein